MDLAMNDSFTNPYQVHLIRILIVISNNKIFQYFRPKSWRRQPEVATGSGNWRASTGDTGRLAKASRNVVVVVVPRTVKMLRRIKKSTKLKGKEFSWLTSKDILHPNLGIALNMSNSNFWAELKTISKSRVLYRWLRLLPVFTISMFSGQKK